MTRRKRWILCSMLSTILLLMMGNAQAALINVPETFGDGGAPAANGWHFKAGSIVANAGDAGPGDHALLYSAATPPGQGTGFHVLHPVFNAIPNPVFVGDYLAAGAVGLQFKARHTGNGDAVSLRAMLFDDFAVDFDWAMSSSPVVIANTATTWQTYNLSLAPAALVTGGVNGLSATDILSAVFQVGLRHDPLGTGPQTPSPVASSTSVFFDDIMLIGPAAPIPEPSTALLAFVGLLVLLRKRHQGR